VICEGESSVYRIRFHGRGGQGMRDKDELSRIQARVDAYRAKVA